MFISYLLHKVKKSESNLIHFTQELKVRFILLSFIAQFSLVVLILLSIPLLESFSQNIWTSKTNFPATHRENPVSFAIDGKGYLATGGNFGFGQFENDFWEYDPLSDTWTQKANLGASGRINAVSFVIDDIAYVGMGQLVSMLIDFWKYNPNTNLWTQLNDFPGQGRIDASSFVIDNFAYIVCGFDGTNHLNDVWRYNSSNDSWIQLSNFPSTPRRTAVSFAIDDKGYLGAGVETNTWVSFNDFWEYNPKDDSWTQKQNYPSSYAWGSQFVIANKAYAGISFGPELYEYDPRIDTWTQKASMGTLYRAYGIGFSIGTKGYMGLGTDNCCTDYFDFWEYTPGTTPSVETSSAISIYDTKAILKGEVIFDGNYEVLKRGFVWSTTDNPTLNSYPNGNVSESELTNQDVFLDTISGLSANTHYYLRAYATNTQGTSYGKVIEIYTKYTIAQDGNQDGILDALQDFVKTVNDNNGNLITVMDLNENKLFDIEFLQANDEDYLYPFGMIKFKVNASRTKVRLYFHNYENLKNYIYRKLDKFNVISKYDYARFSKLQLLDKKTAYIDLELVDGGIGDYDGIVNGIIVDPGGPAIAVSSINAPIWDDFWRIFVIAGLAIIPIFWLRRRVA